MDLAPVLLFVYNRPVHTQRTVESLQQNTLAHKSDLFIFSDGPKSASDKEKVLEVRHYLKTIEGFKSVTFIERELNLGLADSIIRGVSEVINVSGKAIIVEDDLLTSRNFLAYMNSALLKYEETPAIFSVTGMNNPIKIPANYKDHVYLSYRASSWGWGTWKDRWCLADWEVRDFHKFIRSIKKQWLFNRGGDDLSDTLIAQMKGRINSWAIRWNYTHFRHNAFCVYPIVSKVQNIGFDGSGIHCGTNDTYVVELDNCKNDIRFPDKLAINDEIVKSLAKLFSYSLRRKISRLLKRIAYGYIKV